MERAIFVEGLQGAGKSTMVNRLSQKNPEYTVYREGDYVPVELAWCAYVDQETYQMLLEKYSGLKEEIYKNTVREEDAYVIAYTKILTEIPGFHKDLEQYEIYNGNKSREQFEEIVLKRYQRWNPKGEIFECAFLQNILENMLLYLQMEEEEILDFYRRLKEVLVGKKIEILYLDVENIRGSVEIIKKERSDENGVELWFPMMVRYIEDSPYGKAHELLGMEGLLIHLERRKKLEHRILKEVFGTETHILRSKQEMPA